MGRSRVSGPWAGAYNTLNIQIATLSGGVASTGTQREVAWGWTIPSGMDIVIVNVQGIAQRTGTNTRFNILAGGASIFQNDGNSSTANGVQIATAAGRTVPAVTATLSNGTFGTASTSIIAPTTPSLGSDIVKPVVGAYVVGGATLCATVFQGSGFANSINLTLVYYPVSHISALKSAFE